MSSDRRKELQALTNNLCQIAYSLGITPSNHRKENLIDLIIEKEYAKQKLATWLNPNPKPYDYSKHFKEIENLESSLPKEMIEEMYDRIESQLPIYMS
jgi:hypothetical protein